MSKSVRTEVGGPHPGSCKNWERKTAESIEDLHGDKDNPSPSAALLARTIACRPPNEDRLRGIA